MQTKETLKRLRTIGTKIQADDIKRDNNVVFMGDLAQVLVRAYEDSNGNLVKELYDALVFQSETSASNPNNYNRQEIRLFALGNLDWISQCADECRIKPVGDVGNLFFVSNLNGPKYESTGPINEFYRKAMDYNTKLVNSS